MKNDGGGPLKNDGGPAFPGTIDKHALGQPEPGMSLRDYFATAVIPSAVQILWEAGSAGGATTRAAKIAYEVADAMLAERGKP